MVKGWRESRAKSAHQQYFKIPKLAITAFAKLHLRLAGRGEEQDAIFRVKAESFLSPALQGYVPAVWLFSPQLKIRATSAKFSKTGNIIGAGRDEYCDFQKCCLCRNIAVTSGSSSSELDAKAIVPIKQQRLEKHSSGQKLEFSKYLKAIISYIWVSFIVFKVLNYSMNSQQPTSLCYI